MDVDKCEVLSEEKIKLLEEKAQRRYVLRNQFLKERTDPFRHASGQGGHVFDVGYMRYQAYFEYKKYYFKPSLKTITIGLFYMVIPGGIYAYFMHKSREEQEKKYRRGAVAYRDRLFKFV